MYYKVYFCGENAPQKVIILSINPILEAFYWLPENRELVLTVLFK